MDEGTCNLLDVGSCFLCSVLPPAAYIEIVPTHVQHFEHWPKNRPICVHAEEKSTAAVILLAELYKRHVHVCHVARREEVGMVL